MATGEHALPAAYMQRLRAQLGAELDAYLAALVQPAPVTLRLNPARPAAAELWPQAEPLPLPNAFALAERPAFVLDPAWHAGAYYVQEYSSMHVAPMLAQVLAAHLPDRPLRVLDRCAAPGGKATHLASVLPEQSLLVACEPVSTRRAILIENLTKWGITDLVVQAEPAGWAEGSFDAIVIDAPCSGEGLFRRQPEAVSEWSPAAVDACAARQADILARTLPLLAPGGWLAYSTCTAAPAENAQQVAALLHAHLHLRVQALPQLEALGWVPVTEGSALLGYQAWPHRVRGEGLFLALMQCAGEPPVLSPARHLPRDLERPRQPPLALAEWLDPQRDPPEGWQQLLHRGQPIALSAVAFELLREAVAEPSSFHAARVGLPLGERKGADFIPSQALALSPHLRGDLPVLPLSRTAALAYLKREAFTPELPQQAVGWHLARYGPWALGWVKALAGGRLNNYFPPTWRIRRDLPAEL